MHMLEVSVFSVTVSIALLLFKVTRDMKNYQDIM